MKYAPLTPQTTQVPLFAGQDSSTDPRVLQPGFSSVVENGRLERRGQAAKRYGFTSLPKEDSGGTRPLVGQQVFSAGNNLFLDDKTTLRTWNENAQNWTQLASFNAAPITARGTVQSAQDVTELASAASDAYTAVAWSENGSVYLTVVDNDTGAQTISRLILTPGSAPNVVQLGGDFYIFAIQGGGTAYLSWILRGSNPFAVTPGPGLPVAPGNGRSYAVTVHATQNAVVGVFDVSLSNLGAQIQPRGRVYRFDTNLAPTALGLCDTGNLGPSGSRVLWSIADIGAQLNVYTNPVYVLCSYGLTTDVPSTYNWVVQTSSAVAPDPVAITTAPSAGYSRAVGTPSRLFIERVQGVSGNTLAGVGVFTFTNGAGAPASQALLQVGSTLWTTGGSTRLATQAYTANGNSYAWTHADAGFQSQYLMLDQAAQVVATSAYNGEGAPWDQLGVALPYLSLDGASTARWAERYRADLRFDDNGVAFSTIGATVRTQNYAQAHVYAAQFEGVDYISGPAPMIYDQARATEWGFRFYPTVTLTSSTGGGLTGGVYFVTAVYAWYDNTGKLWRSPTSFVSQVTVPAGGSIQAQVSYLFGSLKSNVFIELYCTANIGGQTGVTQFKVLTATNPATPFPLGPTSPPQAAASLAITQTDAQIQGGELLYTSGNVPSYQTPPALSFLSSSGLRLYGVDSENNTVVVTSPAGPARPLNFVETQEIPFQSGAEPIVSAVTMNGQLYAASAREWFSTNADTNDLSAQVITFGPPKRLAVATGVVRASSVFVSQDGIYYQSVQGIRLLAQNEVSVFVGRQVDNLNDDVLDVYQVPAQQQVRFVQAARTLVFNYVDKLWAQYVWANTPSVLSGCRYGEVGCLLAPDGTVRREQVGVFADDATPVVRRIETAWFRPGGFPGWGRTWRAMIVGERKSPHTLQVRIAYEDDPTWIDTLTISSEQVYGTPAFGGGLGMFGRLTSGSGINNPFGLNASGNAFKFELIMPRSKAGSFKFEITEVDSTGEDSCLNYLALLFGVAPGITSLPVRKQFG